MGYDIIGDIHGHADALVTLLRKLGYREQQRAWKHPGRTAIFVGDFIDRGPGQLETVNLVRSMVEAGAALAVMGNHEFNAIAWNTPHPDLAGEYLRRRNAKNHVRFSLWGSAGHRGGGSDRGAGDAAGCTGRECVESLV